jgi:hypothetical protein
MIRKSHAEVAELADAHGSGPCTRKGVGVRVPSSAPKVSKVPRLCLEFRLRFVLNSRDFKREGRKGFAKDAKASCVSSELRTTGRDARRSID